MWIGEYKNNNKSNETNVNNFYNHLSNISNLSMKSNDLYNEHFWNLLFSFIELKECRNFIRFLKNILDDNFDDENDNMSIGTLQSFNNMTIGSLNTDVSLHTNDIPHKNLDNKLTNSSKELLLSSSSINF